MRDKPGGWTDSWADEDDEDDASGKGGDLLCEYDNRVTKRYILQNGMCYKMVRVTKW